MKQGALVVVGMSGGVDSSVAACLLHEQGFRVIGVMLRLWADHAAAGENRCCAPDAVAQARRVAATIGIPFYTLDAQELFRQRVVGDFLAGYLDGLTPNPCLVCNRTIRWGFLFDYAQASGADYLATGHYAQLRADADGLMHLHRAVDRHKDQSYVLSVLNQRQLSHTLLPLGEWTKADVRAKALALNLSVAQRPDSQDLCFISDAGYHDFLQRNSPAAILPGPIVNLRGEVLGTHAGLPFYTIGQRKGLGIAAAAPLYVMKKDLPNNRLVVAPAGEMGAESCHAADVNWITGAPPPGAIHATVQIRYKSAAEPALITPEDALGLSIHFTRPLRDITPGQRAVIYQDDECLGGGTITMD